MEITIFHKSFILDIPQDIESKCLKVCEILEKEENLIGAQFSDDTLKLEECFPLIALSAVTERMQLSNTAEEQEPASEMHTISIKLPSFNNISEEIEYKTEATPFREQFLRAAAAKISSQCNILKEAYSQEDADVYRIVVFNVLLEQIQDK